MGAADVSRIVFSAMNEARRAAPFKDVAHLLRHLRNPSALRKNPIAASYFSASPNGGGERSAGEGLAAVLALVSTAVERVFAAPNAAATDHALRQRAIVEQCDLHGKPHAAVAAGLGLSRRQFYRERREARMRLANYFARIPPRSIESLPDEFNLGLTMAESLCRLGRRSAATAEIKRLRARAASSAERIRANLALASVYSEAGSLDAADNALLQARSVFGAESDTFSDAPLIGLEIDAAQAQVLWLTGRLPVMKSALERMVTQLRSPALVRTERAIELEAQSWMRLGMLMRDVGDASESMAHLRRAAVLLRALPRASPSLRAELAANFGLTRMLLPSGLTEAAEPMRAYLQIAQEYNLLCDVADALANLATLHLQSGDVPRARTFAQSGLDLARRVSSRRQGSEIAVIAALAEAEAGNMNASLGLIEHARAGIVGRSPSWAVTGLAEAQALLYARDFGGARRVASETAATMSDLGMSRYRGAALRIAAEAAEGAKRHGDAVRTIREAIAVLETHGHAASLARAYECHARLTQTRGDAHRARQLRQSLRQPLNLS